MGLFSVSLPFFFVYFHHFSCHPTGVLELTPQPIDGSPGIYEVLLTPEDQDTLRKSLLEASRERPDQAKGSKIATQFYVDVSLSGRPLPYAPFLLEIIPPAYEHHASPPPEIPEIPADESDASDDEAPPEEEERQTRPEHPEQRLLYGRRRIASSQVAVAVEDRLRYIYRGFDPLHSREAALEAAATAAPTSSPTPMIGFQFSAAMDADEPTPAGSGDTDGVTEASTAAAAAEGSPSQKAARAAIHPNLDSLFSLPCRQGERFPIPDLDLHLLRECLGGEEILLDPSPQLRIAEENAEEKEMQQTALHPRGAVSPLEEATGIVFWISLWQMGLTGTVTEFLTDWSGEAEDSSSSRVLDGQDNDGWTLVEDERGQQQERRSRGLETLSWLGELWNGIHDRMREMAEAWVLRTDTEVDFSRRDVSDVIPRSYRQMTDWNESPEVNDPMFDFAQKDTSPKTLQLEDWVRKIRHGAALLMHIVSQFCFPRFHSSTLSSFFSPHPYFDFLIISDFAHGLIPSSSRRHHLQLLLTLSHPFCRGRFRLSWNSVSRRISPVSPWLS